MLHRKFACILKFAITGRHGCSTPHTHVYRPTPAAPQARKNFSPCELLAGCEFITRGTKFPTGYTDRPMVIEVTRCLSVPLHYFPLFLHSQFGSEHTTLVLFSFLSMSCNVYSFSCARRRTNSWVSCLMVICGCLMR